MKFFNVFVGIIGFFVILFIVSLFFPRKYYIERTTVVNKPVYFTYAYMNNIENWKDWSPWNTNLDSTFSSFYSPNTIGTGATQYIKGSLIGTGRFKITHSQTNQLIRYDLQLSREAASLSSAAIYKFSAFGERTKLSWLDSGDVGYNPINRFMLPSKIKSTEIAFEEGLRLIKKSVEKY